MENLGAVIIVLLVAAAAIGFVVGLVKGYTKINSWVSVVALTALIVFLASQSFEREFGYIPAEGMEGDFSKAVPAVVTLALVAAFSVVFTMLSSLLHKIVKSGMEKHQKLDSYKNYDEVEENNRLMADAVANNDMHSYNRLSKRKFNKKSGGWGVADKVLGGVTLALKSFVICGMLAAFLLIVLDFIPVPDLQSSLSGVLNETWDGVKPVIMDVLTVMIITLVINSGIKNGASGMLWGLIMLGLAAGLTYLAYYIVFETATFDSAAAALGDKILGEMGDLGANISKGIIMAGLCILLWILTFIVSRLGPSVITAVRSHSVTRVIDGAFGVIIVVALALGILLFLGNVLQSMVNLDFMQGFNSYFKESFAARYIYGDNLLAKAGLMPLNLGELLG